MARPLRVEYAGAHYHITSRGNAKQAIFADEADRETLLGLVDSTVKQFGWAVYAYCLMGNHYHLLLETPAPNLSRGMRHLNGVYTQRFNRRHDRVGHLFQGRYGAILVERETYLLELVRYIALNPVRAGLASSAEEWRWSSHRAHAALAAAPSWLRTEPVLERFASAPLQAPTQYRRFVEAGVGLPGPWSALRGQVLLGSDSFAERFASLLEQRPVSREVPRADRLAARPALEALLPAAESTDLTRRNAAILRAYLTHGYTLAEIARHLGLHYSTVSRIAQALMRQFKT
jgi:REP element-mobilizing transposase RayT/DNA-binding CsgD family transcriptional regulator